MVKKIGGNKVLKNVARVTATATAVVAGSALFNNIRNLDGLVRISIIENYSAVITAVAVILAIAVSCTALTVSVMHKEKMFEVDETVENI